MQSENGLSGSSPRAPTRVEPAILELAGDLKDVADSLERDWREHGVVREDVADRLHKIRERAEALFGRSR